MGGNKGFWLRVRSSSKAATGAVGGSPIVFAAIVFASAKSADASAVFGNFFGRFFFLAGPWLPTIVAEATNEEAVEELGKQLEKRGNFWIMTI